MMMRMNDICIYYETCMNDGCYGISKHIHLEEDVDVLFEDFCLLFGDGDPEKRRTLIPPMHYLTKSWALILLRLGESGRQSVGDLVCRSCCGKVKRRSTGDFKCKSCRRAFDSYWETGLEGSRARCNLGLRYKRCRFPPVHYLTKFQVWILLLEKTGNAERYLLEIDISAGDEVSLLGD